MKNYSVAEAADKLGISYYTLIRKINSGLVSAKKLKGSRNWVLSDEDLEKAYVENETKEKPCRSKSARARTITTSSSSSAVKGFASLLAPATPKKRAASKPS